MRYEFEAFDYVGELPKVLTEGDVVSVRMMEDDNVADVPLYIRRHVVSQDLKLQGFLSNTSTKPSKQNMFASITKRELYVSGAHGCGKTAFMTLAAHRYAKHQSRKVLMVNFRDPSPCYIFKIDGDATSKIKSPLDKTDIVEVVKEVMKQDDDEHFDLVILDGVRQKLEQCSQLMSVLNALTGKDNKIDKVVHTTSLEFHMSTGDKQQGIRSRIQRANFDSFVQDDYQKAFASKKFLRRLTSLLEDILQWQKQRERILEQEDAGTNDDDEQAEDVIMSEATKDRVTVAVDNLKDLAVQEYATRKFFYAGGSARFMFEFTTDQLKNFLDSYTSRLKPAGWEEFASASLAPQASNAVNSLMQQFSGKAVAVSRYILLEAYDQIEGRLVQAVQAVADATGNPLLKGWAFELKQLDIIKSVLKQSKLDGGVKVVGSKEGLAFRPVLNHQADYDGITLTPRGEDSLDNTGTIIWCLKWNQGCFDVAFYKSRTLLTLQFAVSADHSLKLQYIKALKEALEVHSSLAVETCIHVGVVGPAANFTNFKFKSPEGGGRSSWNPDFTVKAGKTTALFALKEELTESFSASPLAEYQVYTRRRPISKENSATA